MQEFENKQEKNEKIIDIKGTLEDFIEEEKPELSQEEAIKAYKEGDIIGLLNATFIESKIINNLKENDINYDFYGYDNFKSFKESLQNSFLGETVNIYKVILKEKY